jgi:ketosteroid isomerase-like protein
MLDINIPEVVAEVREAFTQYECALIANNTETLDALFWNSTHTVRFGVRENLYGFAAIAEFRRGQPSMDFTRMLKNTIITSYGRDFATANTEFQRIGSTMTGRQSHVWLRTEAGWKIAAAHVSLLPLQA